MTTSGTYNFAPNVGDLILNAYDRIQIRPSALTQDHMINARTEGNFLQVEWQNKGVSLWTVDLETVPLIQGTASYSVPAETVMILDAYIGVGSPEIDRFISPISRTDYAAQANKTQQGFPTTYWFDRLISPTITLWPVPDQNSYYTLKYYRYRVIQDAEYAGGIAPEVPYLFLDAWTACLAHRLARIYAPQMEQQRKADAVEAWNIAAAQNTENVPIFIRPDLSPYYR